MRRKIATFAAIMPNDFFQFRQFTVRQGLCAMKVGTDGTLLGAWASVPSVVVYASKRASILDIGTGTGLIALMMAQRHPQALVTAIDIDPQAVRQARENAAASPFADRINIIEGDIRKLLSPPLEGSGEVFPFDAIVCNPPFFDSSLESPDAQRTLARHTSSLSYRELMACAWQLLSEDGVLSVVIPSDCKARLEAEATLQGFFLTRSCAVRTTPKKPPRRFLLAFKKHPETSPGPSKGGESDDFPPPSEGLGEVLVIGSDAYRELMKDFYLK